MELTFELIQGVSLGFETFTDEDTTTYYIIDLLIFRILLWTLPTNE